MNSDFKIKVAFVDDHILTLKGTQQILIDHKDIDIVLISTNAKEILNSLKINANKFDVILMDLNMPIMNGVELTKKIKSSYSHVKIIVLSMIDDVNMIHRMVRYGVDGYLLKNNIQDEMSTAIRQVYQGGTFFNQNIREALIKSDKNLYQKTPDNKLRPRLSKREKEVLDLVVKEYTTPEIAKELYISEGTVITHRKHLLSKMNAKNAAGLVRIALEWGLV